MCFKKGGKNRLNDSDANEIIRDEYFGETEAHWVPPPNLPLTSITWSPKGTGGWWCGYGWVKGGRL